MKLKMLILSIVFGSISSAWSNIYSCKSPTAKPLLSKRSIKNELILSTFNSDINSNEINVINLENKSPFLIYYAIDSKEAFMQYSVLYEVAKLQQACRRNSNVQFIAFLNSLYVEKNSFILCKDKQASILDFREYPSLNEKLISKRKYFSSNKHQDYAYGPLDYLVELRKDNQRFWNYPLAHPDFLYELIKFTITNKKIFPNETYAAFINLKSHGSQKHVLSGMQECQEKAKNLSSEKIVASILSKREIKFLKSLKNVNSVERNIITYENIISKLEIGEKSGTGSFINDKNLLGEHRLSAVESYSNAAFGGLGVNEGLGAEYSFGTDQANLGWVMRDLFTSGSDKSLGFMMLESCETNRNPHLYHKYISNIFGYYTARKSLWYRNLNWWEILEKAEGFSVNMVNILQHETSKILNIEVVNR